MKQKIYSLPFLSFFNSLTSLLHFQQMAPAKQAKVIQEFQKQSAQMDMTVKIVHFYLKYIIREESALLHCIVAECNLCALNNAD